MKKLLVGLVLMAVVGYAVLAWAASSATQSFSQKGPGIWCQEWIWTAHTDGSFTAVASRDEMMGYVILAETKPGDVTKPTANYDVTLTNDYGVDVMGGQLADRSGVSPQQAVPAIQSGVYGGRFVAGKLTLNITGNAVNGATGYVRAYIQRAAGGR